MLIFCKLKEKADRAKKARAILSNRGKVNNFIIEFEMGDRVIYEIVDNEDYVRVWSKVIELFYSNHFDIIISNFNVLGLEIRNSYRSNVALEVIKGYIDAKRFVVSFKLYDRWATNYEMVGRSYRITINPVYADTVKLSQMSFFASYPNFSLTFSSIDFKVDDFIQLLYKMKEEFFYKKMENTYNYALDVFIETLQEKKKSSDEDLFLSISSNFSVIIYYNFRITFRHDDPETAILSFKEVGWSWEKPHKKSRAAIYVHRPFSPLEDISEEIFHRIKKDCSVTAEYAGRVIRYILYKFVINLVMIAREEYDKTLNEMFFAELMKEVEEYVGSLLHSHNNRWHFIVIPKNMNKLSLSTKQKIILFFVNHLFSMAKNNKYFQEIENKLEEIARQIRQKKEDALYVSVHYLRDFDEIKINVFHYDAGAGRIRDAISIEIKNTQEYYRIETIVKSDFYSIDKNLFNNILSSVSISTFLELLNINMHNFEFLLRNIEAEFVNFD